MDLAPPDSTPDRVTTNPETPAAIAAARSRAAADPLAPLAPPAPTPRAPLITNVAQLEQAAAEAAETNAMLHAALPGALAKLRKRGAEPPKPRIPSGRYPVPALRSSTG